MSDRQKALWTAVFCSCWHGVSKDMKLQLELLSKQRPFHSAENVFAIHGPSVSLEMMLWEAMSFTDCIDKTLMDSLIQPVAALPHSWPEKSWPTEQIKFSLNNSARSQVDFEGSRVRIKSGSAGSDQGGIKMERRRQ